MWVSPKSRDHFRKQIAMTSHPSPGLDSLVEQTRGAQPMRRLFHAFNGTAVAVFVVVFAPPRTATVGVLGGLFLLLLTLDLLRLRSEAANKAFFRWFGRLASPREASRLASSTWYALGIVLALALFPWPLAISGILVMALADPAASYIGARWGQRSFLGGSVLGFVVFVGVAGVILGLRHPPTLSIPTALVAALAERRSWPLDDNLAVPLVTAGMLAVLQAVL